MQKKMQLVVEDSDREALGMAHLVLDEVLRELDSSVIKAIQPKQSYTISHEECDKLSRFLDMLANAQILETMPGENSEGAALPKLLAAPVKGQESTSKHDEDEAAFKQFMEDQKTLGL